MTHTCECGNEITSNGWNNNINTILRCEDCTEKRNLLIAEINMAVVGKSIETVYVSNNLFHLLNVSDFSFEISPRKMGILWLQIVEA